MVDLACYGCGNGNLVPHHYLCFSLWSSLLLLILPSSVNLTMHVILISLNNKKHAVNRNFLDFIAVNTGWEKDKSWRNMDIVYSSDCKLAAKVCLHEVLKRPRSNSSSQNVEQHWDHCFSTLALLTFWLNKSLWCGVVLCIIGWVMAFLASPC